MYTMDKIQSNLWTKNFIILSMINFLQILIYFLLNSTIASYTIEKFSASTGQAGLAAGIFIIGTLVGRVLTGRIGYSRKILFSGLILFVLSSLLYFLNFGLDFLIISRFFNGITLGIVTTIVSSIVAFTLPLDRRGEGISYFAVSTALATGVGPFIGLYLTQNSNFSTVFKFIFVLGIVSLIIGLFITFSSSGQKKVKNSSFKITDFIEPKALPISIITLTMTFCFSGVISYINLYSKQISLLATASYFFVIYTIFVLISRPFTGRMLDKKDPGFIMYPSFILYACGLIFLSITTNGFTLLLSAALIALGFGNISSTAQILAIKSAESERLGVTTATFLIFFDMGSGVGPSILGLIIPSIGYKNMYLLLAAIVVIISLLYYLLISRKKKLRQYIEFAD